MKKVSKTLAIVLCLAMILSVTALACWPMYQGDIPHTGQITDAAPHITSNPTVSYLTLPASGSGWSGVDSEPVMHEEIDGNTYAFVQYNGHSDNGGSIAKVKCNDGSLVWNITQATPTAANQLSTPLLVGNTLYYVYNNETQKASGSLSGTQTTNKTLTINVTLADSNGSYRLYVPSYLVSGSGTMAVKVRYGNGNYVYLNVDNDDPAETGSSTSRAMTTSSTTSALNKNYAGVFAAAGSYTIKIEYTISSGSSYKTDTCRLYQNHITLNKINDVTTGDINNPPAVTTVLTDLPGSGQMNTPITTDGNYLYFGTWLSGAANGKYFQIDVSSNPPTYKSFLAGTGYGFYWAGAVPVDTNGDDDYDYVVFGGDGGYLYYRSIANFDSSTVGGVYNLSTLLGAPAGNVRSTISSDGTYIYFTSQGSSTTSYLWRFLISAIGKSQANLVANTDYAVITLSGSSSTSTPAISSKGYIYVGTYGSSTFANNGVRAIPVNNFTASAVVNVASGTGSGTTGVNLPVQSSVIVYSDPNSTMDYVYFTTNISGGKGYCYSFNTTYETPNQIWATPDGNFTLQGMAACNGYLTFGNDANTFYIIAP